MHDPADLFRQLVDEAQRDVDAAELRVEDALKLLAVRRTVLRQRQQVLAVAQHQTEIEPCAV